MIFGNFSKSTCIRMAGDGRDSLIQDFVLRGFLGKKEPMPENLPTPEKSISEIGKEQLKKLKEKKEPPMLDE